VELLISAINHLPFPAKGASRRELARRSRLTANQFYTLIRTTL
jgi:hypothetical protein